MKKRCLLVLCLTLNLYASTDRWPIWCWSWQIESEDEEWYEPEDEDIDCPDDPEADESEHDAEYYDEDFS